MITIQVNNAAALAALQRFDQGSFQSKLRGAVRNTLQAGKAEARVRIIQRYTAKSPLSLGKTNSRVSGLTGTLRFGGKRNQLKKFQLRPSRRTKPPPPAGLHATVVKGQGGILARAFLIKSGAVMARVGRPRLPIKNLKTIALPGMAKAVAQYVLNKMDRQIEQELNAL